MRIEQGIAAPCLNSIFLNLYACGYTQYLRKVHKGAFLIFCKSSHLPVVRGVLYRKHSFLF